MMIINSLLDTDWYKFLMGQVVYFRFPDLWVRYKFINRSGTWFPEGFDVKLREEINHLSTLRLTPEEKEWLSQQKGMNKHYVEWFSNYSFNPNQVKIELKDRQLSVEIEGKWKEAIYWEVPLLAIISELYYKETHCVLNKVTFIAKTLGKRLELLEINFADFGTRRRFSFATQDMLVYSLVYSSFLGTSNPYLAMFYRVKPIGTTAHETVMAMSALYGVKEANNKWIENWRFIYGNDYNIALTDTFTTDYFFKTVPTKTLLLIDGLRQDSGNPEEIACRIIKNWKERKINPKDKKIIFSDNLNVAKVLQLHNRFKDITNPVFGIGTHLTNDCGYQPLNIVIKLDSVLAQTKRYAVGGEEYLTDFKWKPVIKLSDDKGKYTGDKDTLNRVLEEINVNR